MFGFLIILAVISGGLTFGVMMIVGAMLYSGKWALPNSEQRKIQRANEPHDNLSQCAKLGRR